MNKKTIGLLFFVPVLSMSLSGQTRYKAYDRYIEEYQDIAVKKMKKYNIPASILLAQGILESVGGTGFLAVNANNHFGIKCQDWSGAVIHYRQNEEVDAECFRKYDSVDDSFNDQAEILKYNPRYKRLVQYKPDDYKAWANGLQHAGYATSPIYAKRLIQLIDDYNLDKLDKLALKQGTDKETKKEKKKKEKQEKEREKQLKRQQEQSTLAQTIEKEVPQKEMSKSETKPIIVNNNYNVGEVHLIRRHEVNKINDVKYIVAEKGDTYFAVAREFKLDVSDLYKFNDLPPNIELKAGDLVYLQLKRTTAMRGYDAHQIRAGDSMYSIAQLYGIRLASLYKLNKMEPGEPLIIGHLLKLR